MKSLNHTCGAIPSLLLVCLGTSRRRYLIANGQTVPCCQKTSGASADIRVNVRIVGLREKPAYCGGQGPVRRAKEMIGGYQNTLGISDRYDLQLTHIFNHAPPKYSPKISHKTEIIQVDVLGHISRLKY